MQDEKAHTTEEENIVDLRQADAENGHGADITKKSDRKGGRLYNIIYDLILVAGVCLLAGGGYSVYHKYAGEAEDKEMYAELNENFVNPSSTEQEAGKTFQWSGSGNSSSANTIWYKRASVDFDGLNAINEDVVGWIFFENEDIISYPILFSGDDEYYLHHTIKRETSTSASIFLEGKNQPDMEDQVTIIYGHNMKNSSMFGKLRKYKEDENYYERHQYFQILTEDGKAYRYRVFSYFDIDQYEIGMVDIKFYDPKDPSTFVTEIQTVDHSDELRKKGVSESEIAEREPETEKVVINEENTYENYLMTLSKRSLRSTGVPVTKDDKVVGLFTCSSNKGNRLIVYGVRVAEHDFNKEVEETGLDIRTLDR